jgi:hypothetical protein
MKSLFSLFLVLSILIITVSSCEKNTEDASKPMFLFKIRFGKGGSGLVYLSDKNGDIISEKAWKSGSTVTFYLPENYSSSYPNFTVTMFENTDNGLIKIRSYYDIIPGTDWEYFPNSLRIQYGNANVAFYNTPQHDNYILVTEESFIQFNTSLPNGITYPYFDNLYNMILVLGVNNGPNKYLKIDDALNHVYVDLSNMESSVEANVDIGNSSGKLSYKLYGVSYDNPCSTDKFLIGKDDEINPGISQLKIKYPPNMFELFKMYIRDEDGLNSWNQYTYGDIPKKLTRINADIHILNTSPVDCGLSTDGVFDYWGSVWKYEDADNNLFYWYVKGPKGQTKYKLPKIPELIKEKYPNLRRELFAIKSSFVCDYDGFTSFQELNHKYYALGACYFEDPPNFRMKYVYSVTKENVKIDIEDDYSRE